MREAHLELGIPPRDSDAPGELLDLSPWYDAGLDGSWHVPGENSGLAELPHGIHEIDGTQFDLRGVVQLSGREALKFVYPESRSGLGVHRKLGQLHVLHATGWTESPGTGIAVIRLHFADGQSREFPIRYGEEVLDWVTWAPKVGAMSNGRQAWEGPAGPGFNVRLFQSTWENPFPDVEISSIDYESTGSTCAPFLIAITAE